MMRPIRYALSTAIALIALAASSGGAMADCTNPARAEGVIVYNTDHNVMQFCNGTNWIAMGTNKGGDWLDGGSGELYYDGGNVGIGTNNPMSILQVGEPPLSPGAAGDNFLTLGSGHIWTANTNGALVLNSGPDTGASSGIWFRRLTSSADITSYVDLMRIDSDGNVGIGTTNPTTLFQITDQTLFHFSGTDIYFKDNGYITAEGHMWLNIDGNDDSTDRTFTIGTNRIDNTGGTSLFTVREDGSVGIGISGTSTGFLNIAERDAGPNSAGDGASIVIGSVAGAHMELDSNEIHAMSGNAEATLHLNIDGGNVNIGPGAFTIGGTAAKPGGGSWTATSDARLKNVHGAYQAGLDEVSALSPIRFHYKADNPRKEPTDKEYIGLVAQDAQAVMPELVSEGEDGYLNLDPSALTYALINAVKELKAQNESLAKRVEELESR